MNIRTVGRYAAVAAALGALAIGFQNCASDAPSSETPNTPSVLPPIVAALCEDASDPNTCLTRAKCLHTNERDCTESAHFTGTDNTLAFDRVAPVLQHPEQTVSLWAAITKDDVQYQWYKGTAWLSFNDNDEALSGQTEKYFELPDCEADTANQGIANLYYYAKATYDDTTLIAPFWVTCSAPSSDETPDPGDTDTGDTGGDPEAETDHPGDTNTGDTGGDPADTDTSTGPYIPNLPRFGEHATGNVWAVASQGQDITTQSAWKLPTAAERGYDYSVKPRSRHRTLADIGLRFSPDTRLIEGSIPQDAKRRRYDFTYIAKLKPGYIAQPSKHQMSRRFSIVVVKGARPKLPQSRNLVTCTAPQNYRWSTDGSVGAHLYALVLYQNQEVNCQFAAAYQDGDGATRYSLRGGLPEGLRWNNQTRLLTGTPTQLHNTLGVSLDYILTDDDDDRNVFEFDIKVLP